jgi:16S rRNA (uracil1498-N3)-methyltransferase
VIDAPLVFVDDLDAPALDSEDRHHLERVLRLAPGDQLVAADGAGRWRRCVLGPTLGQLGAIVEEPPPATSLTVAFALNKGERPELVVQKLTELGIDRVVPFAAARSVVRWDRERADKHAARLQVTARAAAMQSRRPRLPEVLPLATFAQVSAIGGAAMADVGGGPVTGEHTTVLIGPEGGWAPEERAAGLPAVGLGPHVLRAETAAIAAGALIAALRERLVRPGHAG